MLLRTVSGTRLASLFVAAGILLSRVAGLIREGVFSNYFGTTLYADVFRAALRLPNLLQNLLGEGTLSASFIPVYAELLGQDRKEEAGRTAGAIFGLLLVAAGALALTGVLLAPVLVSVFMPGFEGERRDLTIAAVRIIFPGTGLLVLSAWALGILNSHRRFFVSYTAPVAWNGAIVAALVWFGGALSLDRLVMAASWGVLAGGALQFAVQLPWVLRLERQLRPSLNARLAPVREAIRNAGPAILGRGVVQLSGYIDVVLASLLAAGAVATIGYAQTLYLLPISLFGMSIAAAELPELARQRTAEAEVLRLRASAGLERIAFFVIPSCVAFLTLGDAIVAMLYQRGAFERDDTLLVWLTLIALSIGLVATTGTRLLSSTFFALRDTRTPARVATVRVLLAALLGFSLMAQFEGLPDLGLPAGLFADVRVGDHTLGAVGLAAGSGIAAWIEWWLLRRALRRRLGPVGAGGGVAARMFVAALLAAAAGWGVRWLVPANAVGLPAALQPFVEGIPALATFGLVYAGGTLVMGIGEAAAIRQRLGRLTGRR